MYHPCKEARLWGGKLWKLNASDTESQSGKCSTRKRRTKYC
jgi:hypothetical protein